MTKICCREYLSSNQLSYTNEVVLLFIDNIVLLLYLTHSVKYTHMYISEWKNIVYLKNNRIVKTIFVYYATYNCCNILIFSCDAWDNIRGTGHYKLS